MFDDYNSGTKDINKTEREPGAVSFSFNVKEEIAGIFPERKCCKEAMLAAMLFSGCRIEPGEEGILLEIALGISRTARLVYRLVKELSGQQVRWESSREKFLYKRNLYHILIPDTAEMREYVERWGITGKLQKANIRKACCRRAFLAGAFLSGGSVNSPDKNYHFEIVTKNSDIAKLFVQILVRMEVSAKTVIRRSQHVIYVKKAEEISNLLNILGSHMSLLKFEEARAIKETKEEVRRKVNAETANLDKTAQAATRYIRMIKFLKEKGFYEKLPAGIRQIADLRTMYPEASLKELGERIIPPISKSSVNSRLRRLEELYRKYNKTNKIP